MMRRGQIRRSRLDWLACPVLSGSVVRLPRAQLPSLCDIPHIHATTNVIGFFTKADPLLSETEELTCPSAKPFSPRSQRPSFWPPASKQAARSITAAITVATVVIMVDTTVAATVVITAATVVIMVVTAVITAVTLVVTTSATSMATTVVTLVGITAAGMAAITVTTKD